MSIRRQKGQEGLGKQKEPPKRLFEKQNCILKVYPMFSFKHVGGTEDIQSECVKGRHVYIFES